jgi:hypothetical protein
MNDNGWGKYQIMVLEKLDDLEERGKCIEKKVGDLRVDVAQLKVKAGVWGAVAGFIGAAVPVLAGLTVLLLK